MTEKQLKIISDLCFFGIILLMFVGISSQLTNIEKLLEKIYQETYELNEVNQNK